MFAQVRRTIPATSFIVTHSRKTLEDSWRDVLWGGRGGHQWTAIKSEADIEGRVSVALVAARSANTARVRVTTGRVCTRTVMRLVGKGTAAGLQGGAEGGAGGVKGAFVQARV